MNRAQSIEQKIQQAFQPTHLELVNESHQHSVGPNAETHFRLVLVSPFFNGKSRIQRQRDVMDLLAEERSAGLHALTLRVMTPDEWNQVKDEFEMVSPACHGGSKNEKRTK